MIGNDRECQLQVFPVNSAEGNEERETTHIDGRTRNCAPGDPDVPAAKRPFASRPRRPFLSSRFTPPGRPGGRRGCSSVWATPCRRMVTLYRVGSSGRSCAWALAECLSSWRQFGAPQRRGRRIWVVPRADFAYSHGMDAIQAAAIPEAFFTVWSNLFEIGKAAKCDRCGSRRASGIGTTALMLCREFGIHAFSHAGAQRNRAIRDLRRRCD